MRLTVCWIKLSENGLHICVATEIWETPRSNQAGRAITCAEPQLQYDPWKRNSDFTRYLSITEGRWSQENYQSRGKGRVGDQGFATFHSAMWERREMRRDRGRKTEKERERQRQRQRGRETQWSREKDRKGKGQAESRVQEYSGYQRDGSKMVQLSFPQRQSNITYPSSKRTFYCNFNFQG